jgi:hypothetical protein
MCHRFRDEASSSTSSGIHEAHRHRRAGEAAAGALREEQGKYVALEERKANLLLLSRDEGAVAPK